MKITIQTSLTGNPTAELKGLISRGIKAVEVDANDHLIFTLSDNTACDLGSVRGTGVDSVIQTSASQEDGGDNVFTVTLTDGSTGQFTVKNGSKGSQGEKGETGNIGPQGPAGADGQGAPSDSQPLMAGTAAAGTETNYARGDHVHPTDTSRMAADATPTPAAHHASHAVDGADPITPASIGAEKAFLKFIDTTISASLFVADTTYEEQGFNYRAAVPLAGVSSTMIPDIMPSCADVMSGNLAPVAHSYDGGIYIYAKEIPEAALIIPTIICLPEVN